MNGLIAPARSTMTSAVSRLRIAAVLVVLVFVTGSVGYRLLGLSWLDAVYQTVMTITTVGFREVGEFDRAEKLFTIGLMVTGIGTALYTFTLGVQLIVEGQLREVVGRRRMDRKIAQFSNHVVLCGLGRVGRAVAADLSRSGREVVVVDADASRVVDIDLPAIVGDATDDAVLRAAGIERASALVAALAGDAENLFVTLTGRALRPDLFIVARARAEESIAKLTRAGADRVVNPQELGAARMSSFVVRPHVAEFVDVVMHERNVAYRLQEVEVPEGSSLAGISLRDANLRQRAGVLVLALRDTDGTFLTNPDPDTVLRARHVIIAVGTEIDLDQLLDTVRA